MQSIAEWLEELGLGGYTQRFAENGIDLTVLGHLSDQDLKDLGVLLGHRRKLQAAIARLPDAAPAPHKTAAAPIAKPEDAAERRQLTVMFCDLVGSTALSTRLDPEDLRKIISRYHRHCAEMIVKSGGFVARYMGDGVLAYFGYPQAHEDDAERAVRAGLALVGAATKLDAGSGTALQMRVGIATGLVVVGDLIAGDPAHECEVVGETPNLAARLQVLAEPDTVVIDGGTRRLLGELFEYRALGPVVVRGFDDPVVAWQVTGRSAVDSRFKALRSTTTQLVGREEEFDILLRRWQQAKAGHGCVVLITGEPGIGKSRLSQAILERLRSEPHTRLRYFCRVCSPDHQDTAGYPGITMLQRAAGFRRDDTDDQRLDKLEAVLAKGTTDLSEVVPIFADWLSIPTGNRYPPLDLTPEKYMEKTLQLALAQVEGLAARQPVLMTYEDVQWGDPTTLESLGLLIDRVPALRVLVIVTFRPEFTPPWAGRSHVTLLSLNRLPPWQSVQMIRCVAGGEALPKEVADQIVDRTDGVPLFIEELTKAVIESGVPTDGGNRFMMTRPVPPLAIPTSLVGSLLARLDRSALMRQVAQIGAALGRQFMHDLISAVAPMPQSSLDDGLTQLVNTELVFQHGSPPDAEYTFKHALVQDAAYSTLLHSRRLQLHARITDVLEKRFPEIVDTQPETLARHCAEAGLVEKAVGYWLEAGKQAIARWALIEAAAQLRKGLDFLPRMPDGPTRQEQELSLQVTLGHALLATKGYSAPEPGEVFVRARQLCKQLNRPPKLDVLAGQFAYRLVRGELDEAELHAEEMRHVGDLPNNTRREFASSISGGHTCFLRGKFSEAQARYNNALSLWDPIFRGLPSPEDPYAVGLMMLSRTLLCLGYVDRARLRRDEALAEARRLSSNTLAFALGEAWCGDWAIEGVKSARIVLRSAAEVLAISNRQGFPLALAIGKIMRGWCLGAVGRSEEGIPLFLTGIAMRRATDAILMIPFYLMTLAEAYGMAAQPEQGLDRLAEAAKLIETTQERWIEAEIHRLRGTLLLSMHEQTAAEDSYRHALTVAQRQSAKFWELRAALDLARLWRDQGKRNEARNLLAPVYNWFTEGFDTPLLQEAKALLGQLA
jgi:class 3 adenylate cyclase/predicted ATPase